MSTWTFVILLLLWLMLKGCFELCDLFPVLHEELFKDSQPHLGIDVIRWRVDQRFDPELSLSKLLLRRYVLDCESVASDHPPHGYVNKDLLEDLRLTTFERLLLDDLELSLLQSHRLRIEHWLTSTAVSDVFCLAAGDIAVAGLAVIRSRSLWLLSEVFLAQYLSRFGLLQ